MNVIDPKKLSDWVQGSWTKWPKNDIRNFCFDTRKLGQNECFLAIKNQNNDGHDYVQIAEKQGAVAAIVEHEIQTCELPQLVVKNTLKAFQNIAKAYRETLTIPILALTGSCGKTSAKELSALLLGDNTFKSPENFNNFLGVPYALTHIDPICHKQAVIEVGISSPNEMDNLAEMIQPDSALLLNVEPVHLANFKDIDAIFYEKVKLLNAAKKNLFLPKKWLHLYEGNRPAFYFTTDLKDASSNAIYYHSKMTDNGWSIEVENQKFDVPFKLGPKMAETFAMTLGFILQQAVDAATIQSRLLQWKPATLRGVWCERKDKKIFVDCYNANPASFEDSLQHFYREKPKNVPVAYMVGCMAELGPQSQQYHQNIVRYFKIYPQDVIYCIGDSAQILQDAFLAAGVAADQLQAFKTTTEAQSALSHLSQSCLYLKGSHTYHLEKLLDVI